MKITKVFGAMRAPAGEDPKVIGVCSFNVEFDEFDKIGIEDQRKKDQAGKWEKANIDRINVANIATPCRMQILDAQIRESEKGEVFASVRHLRMAWADMMCLGERGDAAITELPRHGRGGSRVPQRSAAGTPEAPERQYDADGVEIDPAEQYENDRMKTGEPMPGSMNARRAAQPAT